MIKRKIYVVGFGSGYANWMQGKVVNSVEEADLVVFTGGEDVSSKLYGKRQHPTTYPNPSRDAREFEYFQLALSLGKHLIGICRGAQFLCAMSGGILVQDQPNPSWLHPINTYDGKVIDITSTHHQAAYPYVLPKNEYRILGWTNNILAHHWGEDYQQEMAPVKECEIVYYPRTKALGIQGHPESMLDNQDTIGYLRDLLDKHMSDTL